LSRVAFVEVVVNCNYLQNKILAYLFLLLSVAYMRCSGRKKVHYLWLLVLLYILMNELMMLKSSLSLAFVIA